MSVQPVKLVLTGIKTESSTTHPFEWVIITLFHPEDKDEAVCMVSPLVHIYVQVEDMQTHPSESTIAIPFESPGQDGGIIPPNVIVKGSDKLIVLNS